MSKPTEDWNQRSTIHVISRLEKNLAAYFTAACAGTLSNWRSNEQEVAY